jgi:hypothetical protein
VTRATIRVALLACAAAPSAWSAPALTITLSTPKGPVELAAADAQPLAPKIRWLVDSCSVNSIDHPNVFAGRDPIVSWDQARAAPHLLARFEKPFAVNGRGTREPILVSEALVPLQVRGPYWYTRRDGIVVQHTKCLPRPIGAVLCGPAVRPHLDPEDVKVCDLITR